MPLYPYINSEVYCLELWWYLCNSEWKALRCFGWKQESGVWAKPVLQLICCIVTAWEYRLIKGNGPSNKTGFDGKAFGFSLFFLLHPR